MRSDKRTPVFFMAEDWLASQLSIARRYGGARIDGHEYHIINGDLVRKDFIPYYKRLGRKKFMEVTIANPGASDKELMNIYKELTKKPAKDKAQQPSLFDGMEEEK